MAAFLTGCASSMVDLQTTAQSPEPGKAIVVGSFLVEPVPEWRDHDDTYWLSIWKEPVPRKQYTIGFQPNKEKDVLLQLPAGVYEIVAIYEGKPGFWSEGHGRKGGLGLWFELTEGEALYIGRLQLTISPEPEWIRRERDEAVDATMRVVTSAIFGESIGAMSTSRPVLYTAATIEDDLAGAVEVLQSKGWDEAATGRLRKSLITTTEPE
jgi:hypothetical protein